MPPSRRKTVEDSSPKTELAPSLYQRFAAITERRQPVHQVIHRVGLSGLEGEGPASQRIGRQRRSSHGCPGGEANQRPAAGKGIDRFDAPAHRFLIGSQPVEGQGLDGGKDHGANAIHKPGTRLSKRPLGVRHQGKNRASRPSRQPGGEHRQRAQWEPMRTRNTAGRAPPGLQPVASRQAVDEVEQRIRHEISATQKCARGQRPGRA